MTYPHASLTDQQARDLYFVVPESDDLYRLALGEQEYPKFQAVRKRLHATGGELLLIGWPDGSTVAFIRPERTAPFDVDRLVVTYRANASIFRVRNPKAQS
jgi:hypothetical protein